MDPDHPIGGTAKPEAPPPHVTRKRAGSLHIDPSDDDYVEWIPVSPVRSESIPKFPSPPIGGAGQPETAKGRISRAAIAATTTTTAVPFTPDYDCEYPPMNNAIERSRSDESSMGETPAEYACMEDSVIGNFTYSYLYVLEMIDDVVKSASLKVMQAGVLFELPTIRSDVVHRLSEWLPEEFHHSQTNPRSLYSSTRPDLRAALRWVKDDVLPDLSHPDIRHRVLEFMDTLSVHDILLPLLQSQLARVAVSVMDARFAWARKQQEAFQLTVPVQMMRIADSARSVSLSEFLKIPIIARQNRIELIARLAGIETLSANSRSPAVLMERLRTDPEWREFNAPPAEFIDDIFASILPSDLKPEPRTDGLSHSEWFNKTWAGDDHSPMHELLVELKWSHSHRRLLRLPVPSKDRDGVRLGEFRKFLNRTVERPSRSEPARVAMERNLYVLLREYIGLQIEDLKNSYVTLSAGSGGSVSAEASL